MSCEHKGLMSILKLVASPTSARKYIQNKDKLKDTFNDAKIYFFCKRSLPKFENIDNSRSNELCFDIVKDDGKARISCVIEFDSQNYIEHTFTSYSSNSSEEKHELYVKFKAEEARYTPEDLLWNEEFPFFKKKIIGDIKNILTYQVLYVGETVDQGVADRLCTHHALLKIFMSEDIVKNYDKSHEIVILAFKNDNIDTETHDVIPAELIKPTERKKTALDIEQAFINLFRNTYNEIKYQDFPDQNDLLAKGGYNTIVYDINDDIVLIHDNIRFVGKSGDLQNNLYSFLLIQQKNMTLFNPENQTLAKIKVDGKYVPYQETSI